MLHKVLNCGVLILAAGKGTRMHSTKPKVLQNMLGTPLLGYALFALKPIFGKKIWVVVGYGADQVQKAFPNELFILQKEQLGTGHALMTALPVLKAAGLQKVLVVNGDTPLATETIIRFLRDSEGTDLSIATLTLDSPADYGRVIRHKERIAEIIEAKDYDPLLYGPEPKEINAGIYLIDIKALDTLLPQLKKTNRSEEYYITDLIRLAVAEKMTVSGLNCGTDPTLLGINTPTELVRSEELLRQMKIRGLLTSGVILHSPNSIRIGPFVTIASGTEISGPCEIFGESHIAADVVIESFCHINNSHIESGAIIHGFSHLEDAEVGVNCLVGPYARLRPGAIMENESHVGNFVEMKKARLGEGAKANHLSYLGDADIGAGTNIGAGTITCNYDGVHKHHTQIGTHTFIGSNTALVAPVNVGNNAVVGAGSVITKNIPDKSLGVTRSRQKNLPIKH